MNLKKPIARLRPAEQHLGRKPKRAAKTAKKTTRKPAARKTARKPSATSKRGRRKPCRK